MRWGQGYQVLRVSADEWDVRYARTLVIGYEEYLDWGTDKYGEGCDYTPGDNRNETVAATKGHISWYLLWTLSGAVVGVGAVMAASGRSDDVRIHVFSTYAALPESWFLICIVTCCATTSMLAKKDDNKK